MNDIKIETEIYNETHLNILCETHGAHPPPKLKIFIDEINIEGKTDYASNYDEEPWIRHYLLTNYPKNFSTIECEISIPEMAYKRREKLFYYPCADHSSSLFVSYSLSDHIESCMINSNFSDKTEKHNNQSNIN